MEDNIDSAKSQTVGGPTKHRAAPLILTLRQLSRFNWKPIVMHRVRDVGWWVEGKEIHEPPLTTPGVKRERGRITRRKNSLCRNYSIGVWQGTFLFY